MSDLHIPDVDEDVIRRLEAKAAINGTSIQHEATQALRKGTMLAGEERGRVLDELFRELDGYPKVTISGAAIIREVREEEL